MWLSLWSTARYDLRLTDEEFYALTPRKFDALVKRHRSKGEMNEFMLAQLTALVANTGFKSFDEPKLPKDYMPSQRKREDKASPVSIQMSLEDSRAAVAGMFRTLFVNNGIRNG